LYSLKQEIYMSTLLHRVGQSLTGPTVVLALLAGCAQTPEPVTVTQAIQSTATVEAIDYTTRMVTLRDAKGNMTVVYAGPEVRNLAQVKKGDRVVTRYQEAIMAEVVKPGTGVAGVERSGGAVRAAPGERPYAGAVEQVRTTVKVYQVDPIANIVEVTGPRGYTRRIKVMDPKAQEFVRSLKPGDEVEVTFTEALAISVEPAK
jgi:hypothetical protein